MLIAVLGLFSTGRSSSQRGQAAAGRGVNLAAAAFLVFSGKVEWSLVAVMAPASLLGGHAGGLLVTVIPPPAATGDVVFGVVVADDLPLR